MVRVTMQRDNVDAHRHTMNECPNFSYNEITLSNIYKDRLLDTKRVCTGGDSRCSVVRMLRQRFGDFDAWGSRHEKKKKKKKDRPRLCADNDATPEGYPVGPGIMTRMPKEVDKKITWLSTRHGESADRIVGRWWINNASRIASKLSSWPNSSAPIAMYRKAFTDQNGLYPSVEWRRHVSPGRSNLHHPVTTPIRPSLSRPFPRATMCFSSVLMVGELVVVNNIVTELIYKCKRTEEYIVAMSVKVQLFAECLYEPRAAVWIAPREKT
ncbi:hypothetical protein G5I_11308 [Acromyrmex echinatior]|uniref:Uncharacterized protein n=1 Tax=Acromyrmex echinatior TaxID=103372 RepID=F4WZ93_ACREC|nr:hypothetical protein G5I_11308 [Acromyrmex echinatior]